MNVPAPPLPPGRPRLVVTGFMGTGKSTAGCLAAAALGLPFVDLDEIIERGAGLTIAALFDRDGEAAFRRLEEEALWGAARLSGVVVATGGGAVLHEGAFAALALDAEVAVLTCGTAELARRLRSEVAPPSARVGSPSRPLLGARPGDRIAELLAGRRERYEAAGRALDTTVARTEAVAAELVERYRASRADAGPARIGVPVPDGPTTVLIGAHALDVLGPAVAEILAGARALVAAETAVAGTIGAHVASSLRDAGMVANLVEVPGGEPAKHLETVAGLWHRFREAAVDRADAVVAVGGGAALDTIGFAAATYARGLPLVNVPTTLLAMVDASVGGKVGIDHRGVKNLIGAFHHPRLVVADPATLGSLPVATLRQGLAEAVKAFVVGSPLAVDVLETTPLDESGLPADLAWVIEQAVRVKAGFVAVDPRDHGARHALNLGHTFAHAIESASGFAVSHGEAVAAGIVAAARLGEGEGITPAGTADRLARLLRLLGLPDAAPEGLDRRAMLDAFAADKKHRAGAAQFVVPAPGGVELLEGIDPDRAFDALRQGNREARG